MRYAKLSIPTLLLLSLTSEPAFAAPKADLVIVNANVLTGVAKKPKAEAIAIAGDRIVYVGDSAGAKALQAPGAKVLDLKGATVTAGFVDAHAHLESLGFDLQELSFIGDASYEQLVEKVAAKAKTVPAGTWISGRGWDQNDWPVKDFPSHAALSAVTPDHPVSLSRVDGHAVLVNKKALDLAKITRDTADPPGGRIVKGKDGEPTGVLVDNASSLVSQLEPKTSVADSKAAILRAQDECFRVGLTGLHDMGVGRRELQAYDELIAEGKLQIRVYAMLDGSDTALVDERLKTKPVIAKGGVLTVRGIKYYIDGALGSRGAALIEPYTDEPANRGLLTASGAEIEKHTVAALRAGYQVGVHAIGDLGNRVVLDSFQKAINVTRVRPNTARLRIEHAQVIAIEDLPRFAKLGVLASMQPTHATSDMPWAEKRVGPDRIRGAYAWRTLLKSGARIAAGSDFPVEGANPLWGVYAAASRQDHEGQPEGGWRPEERMTRDEALLAFTLGSAWAGFEEKEKGTIEKGKIADLTVFDRDIVGVPVKELLETKVLRTIVGGKTVYERGTRGSSTR